MVPEIQTPAGLSDVGCQCLGAKAILWVKSSKQDLN